MVEKAKSVVELKIIFIICLICRFCSSLNNCSVYINARHSFPRAHGVSSDVLFFSTLKSETQMSFIYNEVNPRKAANLRSLKNYYLLNFLLNQLIIPDLLFKHLLNLNQENYVLMVIQLIYTASPLVAANLKKYHQLFNTTNRSYRHTSLNVKNKKLSGTGTFLSTTQSLSLHQTILSVNLSPRPQ